MNIIVDLLKKNILHNSSIRLYLFLSSCILFSVFTKLLLYSTHYVLNDDELNYIKLVDTFLFNETFHEMLGFTHYPPLLIFAASPFALIFQSSTWGFFVMCALVGSLVLLPLYGVLQRLFDSRVIAGITVLLYIIIPTLTVDIVFSHSNSEYLFLLLFVLAMYGFVRLYEVFQYKDRKPQQVIAFASLGNTSIILSALVRPEALLYLVVVTIVLFIIGKRYRIILLANVAGTFLLFYFPYMLYLYTEYSTWMLSGKTFMTYLYGVVSMNPRSELFFDLLRLDESGTQFKMHELKKQFSLIEALLFNIDLQISIVKSNLSRMLAHLYLYRPFYIPMLELVALILALIHKRKPTLVLLLLLFLPSFNFILFVFIPRYLLLYHFFVCILLAVAIGYIFVQIKHKWMSYTVLLFLLVALATFSTIHWSHVSQREYDIYSKKAAMHHNWQQLLSHQEKIIIPYELGRELGQFVIDYDIYFLPYENWERISIFMQYHNISNLLITSNMNTFPEKEFHRDCSIIYKQAYVNTWTLDLYRCFNRE
jgi:MFS family permease